MNFSLKDKLMSESIGWSILQYVIFGALGAIGLFFCGIVVAAYVSGLARDRDRDRASELSAILDADVEH